MSLLSALDDHEKNPSNKWGRFSSPSSGLVHNFSNPPENDDVQLVTLSPTLRSSSRRFSLQNHGHQSQTPIEIKDNETKLRSNTDRNPKDFHVQTSDFVIPKTKKQTLEEQSKAKSSTIKNSEQEYCGRRKVATKLELFPDAQGRATKRRNTNDHNTTPRKLRRPWLHAKSPTSSGSVYDDSPHKKYSDSTDHCTNKDKLACSHNHSNHKNNPPLTRKMEVHIVDLNSSQETGEECEKSPEYGINTNTSSRLIKTSKSCHTEETRCSLCNAVIDESGCLTCPKTSDEDLSDNFLTSDEVISQDGFLISSKKHSESKEKTREKEEKESERQKNDESERTCLNEVNYPSSESKDSDFIETSEVHNITQDDIFCPLCGEARSKNGCGCSKQNKEHSTDSFYPNKNLNSKKYSGKKYGGTCKVATKRKKRLSNVKKNSMINQTTLDTSGHTQQPKEQQKRGRKKKVVTPKIPECVHISSDEDEEASANIATTNDDGNVQNSNNEAMNDDNTCDEIENKTEKLNIDSEKSSSLDDFIMKENENEESLKNGIQTKRNGRKQKKVENKLSMFSNGDCLVMNVKNILVGELFCKPKQPVQLKQDRILIKVNCRNQDLDFKLEKGDLTSFKIHSEEKPLIVILTPTPYWGRKYVERYKEMGIFIDPGNMVYSKKYIMFILNEEIKDANLEALIELIDCNLSDEPIVEKISQSEADAEGERILSVYNNKMKNKPVENSQLTDESSPQDSNDFNKRKKFYPVTKTYSTRSKSSESVTSVVKKPKTILVYQPSSKLDGVTITNVDLLCLEPSTYLNDVIIDFFLKYLIEEKLTAKDRERIHIFSTFFYDRLTQKNNSEPRTPSSMHRMVKSWTKHVDIFSKDFLIIPINESSHWYLVIICYPGMVAKQNDKNECNNEAICLDTTEERNEEEDTQDSENSNDSKNVKDSENIKKNEIKNDSEENKDSDLDDFDKTLMKTISESKIKKRKSRDKESAVPIKARPCVLVFDSLGSSRRSQAICNLRHYLNCEWKERKSDSADITFDKDTLKACYPKVPLQENFSDCGLYVLQYFESFFTDPIEDYKFPIDLRSWFPQEQMTKKRQHITNMILELQAKAESLQSR